MRSILWAGAVLAVTCTAAAAASVPTQATAPPGDAALRAPSGCPTGYPIHVTVTGTSIAQVTFYVDNQRVKFLAVPNQPGGRWTLSIRIHDVDFGSHRVRARIQFLPASRTATRTLRASFNHCPAGVVPPRFTG